MVWDWIAGNWKQLIGVMQDKWGKLSHNDLATAAGKREQLVGLLQKHYGYEKARAEMELDDLTRKEKTLADTKEATPVLKT